MRFIFALGCIILIFLISSCNSSSVNKTDMNTSPLYSELQSDQTGITFNNFITETNDKNHLKWSAIYSGAGVAVGDLDNDGDLDICFAGNQVADELYVNEGNMKFTNITSKAGILNDGNWSTGVSMADVNNDGYLDIYICRMSDQVDPSTRRNLLYINNGNLTFTEKAKEYGLADGGYSTQATFFDYDLDGDMDLFVLNQPPDSRLISRFGLDVESMKHLFLDKFYENLGNGQFREISKETGLSGYGYGLNVVASDLNDDGKTDLYVTNDYYEPDFLYINNGDGTFTNTINDAIKHISNFSMGSDVADFDNDGLVDIGVVDMAASSHFRSKTNMGSMRPDFFWKLVKEGNHYQYMFNTLQKNNGNNTFSEIGLMAGIAKTDWSWSYLMNDFDNDGFKDIVITNGIKRDIRNNDFQYKIKALNEQGQKQFMVADVLNLIPSTPLTNYLFKNDGFGKEGSHTLSFSDYSEKWGFTRPGFSHGMSIGDLDNDGDLDMVINNSNDPASLYENVWGNQNNYIRFDLNKKNGHVIGMNAKITIEHNGTSQLIEITGTKGYLSNSECVAHFGLGDIKEVDKVTITWVDGSSQEIISPEINKTHYIKKEAKAGLPKSINNQETLLVESKVQLDQAYQHREDDFDDFEREILLPHKLSENGPHISSADINGDNIADFYIGGAGGFAGAFYKGQSDGTFVRHNCSVCEKDKKYEDGQSTFLDFDGDGDLDLYVVSGGSAYREGHKLYEDRLYENDGKGNFSKNESALPKVFPVCGEVVKSSDFDGDGDVDLFVGSRNIPGKYPRPGSSYLLINKNGKFVKDAFEIAPDLKDLGMVTDALFTDFDGDQDKDLIIVGEWMQIVLLENSNGNFVNVTDVKGLGESRSWWWSIAEGDFDNDGDMDYLVGNLGKNTKFKASKDKPFSIYGDDFDKNGTNDVVLANFSGDQLVPVRGRQCSSEQMPFIAEKFPTFEGFASASLDGIISPEALNNAVSYKVSSFKSILLRNDGNGFTQIALPPAAQIAPIRDFVITDLNHDGNLDALGVGNLYGAEVETMRYDAGIGICLIGDGQGNFTLLNNAKSGFFVPKDSRSIVKVEGDRNCYIIGNNKDEVQVFVEKKTRPIN